jgi:hypothetical protein
MSLNKRFKNMNQEDAEMKEEWDPAKAQQDEDDDNALLFGDGGFAAAFGGNDEDSAQDVSETKREPKPKPGTKRASKKKAKSAEDDPEAGKKESKKKTTKKKKKDKDAEDDDKKKPKEPKTNKLTHKEIDNAIAAALVIRCGNKEMDDPNSDLHKYVKRHVGAGFTPVPHAAVEDLIDDDTRRIYALTSAWEGGKRVYLQLSRVHVFKIFVDHPEEAPKGEPAAVTRDIRTKDKNNLLVLVKHADNNGIRTGVHFSCLGKATAIVSLDLLFEKK